MTSETEEELDLSAGMIPHPPERRLEKGQRVALPDGSKGRIAHLVGTMKTARVKTDDGRNVTVRLNALKAADSVLVKQHFRRAPS